MAIGNDVTRVSFPGPDWQMLWGSGGFRNFQLDIVGFLAVLGEGSVTANAQVSALSALFYLPRLIPAPQALLWPTRPVQLPPTTATVTGVESGNLKPHIHHVAHILLGDDMPPFAVRCVKVTKSARSEQAQTWMDRLFRGEPKQQKARKTDTNALISAAAPPVIKAKAYGPLAWVILLSFSLSVTLFIASMVLGDGMSLLATLLLSLLSTLIGVVNKWKLKLPQRPKTAGMPRDVHVVIRYPNGSFLVVKCDENIARELYFAPEEIEYNVKSPAVYRLISLAGTLMLMGGVIALANARLPLQIAWAGAYIITNAAHFIAAAVPSKMHWDLSCYHLEEQSIQSGPYSDTFTEALWKTIVLTKNIKWIKSGEAAPRTEVWDAWLAEAYAMAWPLNYELGPLIAPNPIWAHGWKGEKEKGKVWVVPKNWHAKPEWDRINRELQVEAGTNRSSEDTQ